MAVQPSVYQSRRVRVRVSFRQFESHFEGLMDQNEMVFAFIISQGILSRNFQKLANESHLESTSHFRDQWTDLRLSFHLRSALHRALTSSSSSSSSSSSRCLFFSNIRARTAICERDPWNRFGRAEVEPLNIGPNIALR